MVEEAILRAQFLMEEIMKNLTLLSALILLAACGDKSESGTAVDRTADILALTGDATAGETTYTGNCSGCHSADGAGSDSFPALTDATFSEDSVNTVLEGAGSMPSFSGLEDQDIADVLAYVEATF